MKRSVFFIFLTASVIIAACNRGPSNFEGGDPASEAPLGRAVGNQADNAPLRMLIKEGSLSFKTSNIKDTYVVISTLTREHQGYISNEHESRSENRLEKSLSLRIPAAQFDAFVKKVEDHARELEYKNISAKDVTEEFIDLEARLKTKKELEKRYLELLRQARSVADMLSVEAQLASVRADIESMEGRRKYLSDRVNYSTLTISFYEPIGVDFGFASKFVNAVTKGWDNLLMFLIGLVYIWPFLVFLVAGVIAFRYWRRKRKQLAVANKG